jgi:small ligand-binding sensory domain FIST
MSLDDFERPPVCLEKWQGLLEASSDPNLLILIADPFTSPTAEILESLEMVAPGIPAVGALASGARRPGGHVLALNDTLHRSGLIGVSLAGNLRADVLVSQGYKPVGRFFQVTRAEGNVVLELSGVPALEALEQMVSGLDRDEQVLLKRGLMLGEAVSEPEEEPGRGDFLIRPVVGLDHEEGAISIAGLVDEGRRIRFQVWDDTLVDDLQLLLLPQMADSPAAGGLLFSSWPGRKPAPGLRFSVGEIQSTLGYPLPLAGFRGSGEIGPLHGANHLHTHTATLALIRPALPSHAGVN